MGKNSNTKKSKTIVYKCKKREDKREQRKEKSQDMYCKISDMYCKIIYIACWPILSYLSFKEEK